MNAPIEKKVTAASFAAFVASTALLAALTAVQDAGSLVDWMPTALAPFVLALIPTAMTFAAGWVTRHTPRGPSAVA